MITGRPLIISASRRTDLPGYHAESCAKRIQKRISGLRTRKLVGVVFWTKHTRPFLRGNALHDLVSRQIDNPIINLTVTGLGDTDIEPGAPSTDEVLFDLPLLVDAFHKEPWRICWRFDPLLAGRSSIGEFARIASKMAALGIHTCTFSFPSYFSLKGDLTPQFEAAGIPRWKSEDKAGFLREMGKIADPLNIELKSCSQPDNMTLNPNVSPAQCIPADLIQKGLKSEETIELRPDWSQRTHCNCIESEDIGNYEQDRCPGGCVYCYSKAGGPTIQP